MILPPLSKRLLHSSAMQAAEAIATPAATGRCRKPTIAKTKTTTTTKKCDMRETIATDKTIVVGPERRSIRVAPHNRLLPSVPPVSGATHERYQQQRQQHHHNHQSETSARRMALPTSASIGSGWLSAKWRQRRRRRHFRCGQHLLLSCLLFALLASSSSSSMQQLQRPTTGANGGQQQREVIVELSSSSSSSATAAYSSQEDQASNNYTNNNDYKSPRRTTTAPSLSSAPTEDGSRRRSAAAAVAAATATQANATLTSLSTVTDTEPTRTRTRHRRHAAAPGTVQLQEAKRKAAAGGGDQSSSSRQQPAQQPQPGANSNSNNNKRQVIHAMLKGQVVLACNLQPPDPDDAVSLVLWYKDKSMVPIYSVDARSSPIQEARHKPGPWLEGRSSLKIFTQRSSSVVVRNRRQTTTTAENNSELQMLAEAESPSASRLSNDDDDNTDDDDAPLSTAYDNYDRVRATHSAAGRPPHRPHHKTRLRPRRQHEAAAAQASQPPPPPTTDNNQHQHHHYRELSESELAQFTSGWSESRFGERRGDQAVALLMHELPAPTTITRHHEQLIVRPPMSEPRALTSSASSGSVAGADQQQQRQQQLMGHLYIDSLSSEDNGVYLCRVDFRKARSRTQESVLKIVVPADKPTIRDLSAPDAATSPSAPSRSLGADGAVASLDPSIAFVGPHNEGAKVVLVCETQGGYPEPRLTWWRDGRLVDDSYEVVSAADGLVLERHGGQASTGARESSEQQEDGAQDTREQAAAAAASGSVASDALPSPDQMDLTGGANEGPPLLSSSSVAIGSLLEASPTTTSMTAPAPSDSAAGGGKQVAQNRLIRNKLELNGLERADLLANYSCKAWNTRLSEPPTSSIMIDMNLRPIKVQIDNEHQPVLADKPLEVVCRAFGSRPAALITWWRGSQKLVPAAEAGRSAARQQQQQQQTRRRHHDEHQHQTATDATSSSSQQQSFVQVQIQEHVSVNSNVTTSTLSFVPQLDDGGQIISCRAENPYIHHTTAISASAATTGNTIEDSWKLDVHYLPRVSLALGEKLNGQIQEGHDVYFECTARAHPQAHEIRWWFDGKELETNVTHGVIISNQSLVLQRVGRHQRGRYTCSAINSVGESHSNSIHLRVQYAPFCRDASTQPATAAAADTATGGRLGSRPVATFDSAGADPFTALSQQRFKTHYGAARLESVKVYCHVDADPVDSISYRWAFVATSAPTMAVGPTSAGGGSGRQAATAAASWPRSGSGGGGGGSSSKQPEFSGQQLVYLDSSSVASLEPENPLVSVATYTPRSELDYGTLLCWAQNSLGQQSEPCAYQVVPAERPDPVRNCRLVNATDSQLAVACEPGYDGGIDQQFQMEVYDTRKHELVANVTSTSNAAANGGGGGGNAVTHENNGGTDSNDISMDAASSGGNEDDASETASDESAESASERQRRPSTAPGGQPASLVSGEQTVGGGSGGGGGGGGGSSSSRQQKQRHSATSGANNSNNRATTNSGQHHPVGPLETIFITEPNLRPATDYFLSIYSANSKGSSKPVAFTATTQNLSSESIGVSSAATTIGGHHSRDGRRTAGDPSHLLSDVLALSWNPLLVVGAIAVALLFMFASITFAMMKYVDFSGSSAQTTGGGGSTTGSPSYGRCLSTTSSPASKPKSNGGGGGGGALDYANGRNDDDDDQGDEDESSATSKSGGGGGGARARVITVAAANGTASGASGARTGAQGGGGTRSEKAHNISLNGIQQNQRLLQRPSLLLDGSYLRLKIQQLTGNGGGGDYQAATGCRPALKQSNSDNFINQLGHQSNQVAGGGGGGHHHRAIMPIDCSQQAAAFCAGTLPKNMSMLECGRRAAGRSGGWPAGIYQKLAPLETSTSAPFSSGALPAAANHQQQGLIQQQQQQQQMQMQRFESPYVSGGGARPGSLLAGWPASSEDGASAATGSLNTTSTTTSAADMSSLMLANAATGGYASTASPKPTTAAPSQEPRVEQLVISGKQYIHQTSVATSSAAAAKRTPSASLYRSIPQQQQQQQQFAGNNNHQQQRHLQLTSSTPFGSLQLATNLYAANQVEDYHHHQQQQQQQQHYHHYQFNAGQHQQQSHNNRKGSPLVCMDHRPLIGVMQSSSSSSADHATNDQLLVDGAQLAATSGGYVSSYGGGVAFETQAAADSVCVDVLAASGYGLVRAAQHQQQQTTTDPNRVSSENYHLVASDNNNNNSAVNNIGANIETSTGKTATSDLSDELPPIEQCCDSLLAANNNNNNCTSACHVTAHLTLIDGGGGAGHCGDGGANLDSDGMSSGTQRSLATNGSPSSGVAELDHGVGELSHARQLHYFHQTSDHTGCALDQHGHCMATGGGGSSSTITSSGDQQEASDTAATSSGGNVISVLQQHHCHPLSPIGGVDLHQLARSAARKPKPMPMANSGIRRAKKSLNSAQDHPLEQYTVYVDNNAGALIHSLSNNLNDNSRLGEFYVLPPQEMDHHHQFAAANKATLRLVGGSTEQRIGGPTAAATPPGNSVSLLGQEDTTTTTTTTTSVSSQATIGRHHQQPTSNSSILASSNIRAQPDSHQELQVLHQQQNGADLQTDV